MQAETSPKTYQSPRLIFGSVPGTEPPSLSKPRATPVAAPVALPDLVLVPMPPASRHPVLPFVPPPFPLPMSSFPQRTIVHFPYTHPSGLVSAVTELGIQKCSNPVQIRSRNCGSAVHAFIPVAVGLGPRGRHTTSSSRWLPALWDFGFGSPRRPSARRSVYTAPNPTTLKHSFMRVAKPGFTYQQSSIPELCSSIPLSLCTPRGTHSWTWKAALLNPSGV